MGHQPTNLRFCGLMGRKMDEDGSLSLLFEHRRRRKQWQQHLPPEIRLEWWTTDTCCSPCQPPESFAVMTALGINYALFDSCANCPLFITVSDLVMLTQEGCRASHMLSSSPLFLSIRCDMKRSFFRWGFVEQKWRPLWLARLITPELRADTGVERGGLSIHLLDETESFHLNSKL